MEYIKIILLVLINYGISISCHFYLGIKALERRGNWREFVTGFGLLYLLFCVPYLMGIKDAGLVAYILQITGLTGLLALRYKKPLRECIGVSAALFVFVYMFIKSFFVTSSQLMFNQLALQHLWDWRDIVFSVIGDGALLLFVFLIRKKDISIWFSKLYRNRNRFVTSVICIYIAIWLMVSKTISVRNGDAPGEYEKIYFLTLVTFVGGLILLLFIIVGYYRNENKNEKIRMQESMIIQQKMYINTLENLQVEIKKFQHDYKNIVAGLYTVEKSSDTIKFLEENILRFEKDLSGSIKETASLSHIKLEEVKGLILVKIEQAKERGVLFFLEVIKDVECIYMNIVDFNRCLGILIDNGIEAAAQGGKKEIHVVMIQEKAKFVLIVKNTFKGDIPIKNIWENGYSTKGEKRGIGLNNYNEILSKYNCVIKETRVEESYFVQVLKIYAYEKGGLNDTSLYL